MPIDPPGAHPHPITQPKALAGWQLKAGLSVFLVVLIAWNVDWRSIAAALAAADGVDIAVAFALLALMPLLTAERWRGTAAAAGASLPHAFFLRATYAAVFVGQLLPAGVGVDLARIGFLWRRKAPMRVAVLSIALDRALGIAAIFTLLLLGLPFAIHRLRPTSLLLLAGAAIALVFAFIGLLFLDKLPLPRWLLRGPIALLPSLLLSLRSALRTRGVALAFCLGLAIHALSILAVMVLARALGYPLPYEDLLTVMSFTFFAALLPISFNGWGVREGGMVLALSLFAVPREVALLVSLLFGLGSALASLPGSVTWHRLSAAASSSTS